MTISFGSAAVTASGPTITLPSHATGDLIVVVATKGGSGTIPSLPAGWTSAFTASSSDSVRVGWKIAASGAETSGTWTNAEDLAAAVYPGGAGVGAVAWATTTGLPALSLTSTNGSSWVMAATWYPSTPATPAGMTTRATGTYARVADTGAGVASYAGQGGYVQDFGAVVEILDRTLAPDGIASSAVLGSPVLTPWRLDPDGIASSAVLGTPALTPWRLDPAGIASSAVLGTPALTQQTWQEIIRTSWWAEAVDAHQRTVSARVAMLDADGNHVTDLPVTDGQVSFRGEQAEQWSAAFTLTDPAYVPKADDDVLGPASGLRAQVWWRLLVNGGWIEIPRGRFVLDDPQVVESASGGVQVTVEGRDIITIARRATYGSRVIDVGGMTVEEALRALFETIAPSIPVRVDSTTVTLPAVYELTSRDPAEDWTEIAAMAGWVVRSDAEGTIVAGPAPDPNTIRLDLQEGPDCAVTTMSNALKYSTMINSVTVVSTSPSVSPPVSATVEDDDPGSRTWVGGWFGVRGKRVESDVVATVDGARGMARAIYERWRRPQQTVQVTIPARGDVGYRDLAAIARANAGVWGTFRVSGFELPLSAPGTDPGLMTLTMMTRSV